MSPIYPPPGDRTIWENADAKLDIEDGHFLMTHRHHRQSKRYVEIPESPSARRGIVTNLAMSLGFDPPKLVMNLDIGDRVAVYDPEIDTITAVGHLLAVEDVWAWVLVDDDPQPRTYRLWYIGLEPADTDAPEAVEDDEGGRCVEGDRLCVPGSDDWCDTPHPAGNVVCSRPPGHDGPHVACDPTGEHTLETWTDGEADRCTEGHRTCGLSIYDWCGRDVPGWVRRANAEVGEEQVDLSCSRAKGHGGICIPCEEPSSSDKTNHNLHLRRGER